MNAFPRRTGSGSAGGRPRRSPKGSIVSPRVVGLLVVLSALGCADPTEPDVGSVVVEATTTELEIGASVQLVATLLDPTGVAIHGPAVTWESSDERVASVSGGGLVTAVGPGRATITGSSRGASGTTAVTVVAGPCRAELARQTAPGEARDERLERYDCILMDGPYADAYELRLAETTSLRLSMTSDEFDPLLVVTTPAMDFVAYDDDGGAGFNAELVYTFPAGRYLVWATSFVFGETGAYRFTSEIAQMASCDEPVGSLAIGAEGTGVLRGTSCVWNGNLSDPWTMTLQADARLQIDMTSTELDTFLFVTDAAGNVVAYDDDGGGDLNSRWVGDFAAGTYTVYATSYGGRRTGAYRLRLSSAPAGVSPTRVRSDARPPGAAPSVEEILSGRKASTSAFGPKS